MSTIYERLRASERLPGAYEDWSTYREALTDYLCRIIPSDSRILILGAGGCNDLNLNGLLKQGYDITLLDRDCSLMEEGLRRQKIKEGRISFLERDVWPIRKELCETLLLKMQQRMSIENLCDMIRQGTKASMQETLEIKSVYDYVIAVGFHSQINSLLPALFQTAIQEGVVNYSLSDRQKLHRFLVEENDRMIDWLQQQIFSIGQHFVFGLEYSVFAKNDPHCEQLIALFEQGRAKEALSYPVSRVDGAKQLEQWIGMAYYEKKITIASIRYLIWPFLPEKQYLMVIYECGKC